MSAFLNFKRSMGVRSEYPAHRFLSWCRGQDLNLPKNLSRNRSAPFFHIEKCDSLKASLGILAQLSQVEGIKSE